MPFNSMGAFLVAKLIPFYQTLTNAIIFKWLETLVELVQVVFAPAMMMVLVSQSQL